MTRVKPTENQPSLAIFSVIDGIIFIIFFNRENFEQAAFIGILRNIKVHK